MISCRCRSKQVANASVAFLALLLVASCASLRSTSSNRLAQPTAQANAAYETLSTDHAPNYNKAVESLAREIDGETPQQLRTELESVGVKLDQKKTSLPLAR